MNDLISRQQAVDVIRAMQTYKLFAGDDLILVDKAGVMTELMMLPSAQPELIAQDAYVRGFEQGRIQGKVDANLQPEEAIPVSWIEAIIKKFMMTGDAFSGLTASIIRVMLNEWKREQKGDTT